jgi:hypothetical protein
MSAREDLNAYLSQVHRRLRLGALWRGGAIVAVFALAATVVLVLIVRALLFSSGSINAARFTLLCVLALAVGFSIGIPLWRLTRRRAALTAEQRFPQFQQRLLTFTERTAADPFLELLAADTLQVARGAEPVAIATNAKLLAWLGVGLGAAGILIWLIAAAPGFLGYGSHLLWTHVPRGPAPRYEIEVNPGDATIRRHSDQIVSARPDGIRERQYFLYARYQSSAKWERVPMQPRADAGYQFVLTAVPENVEYYVEAGSRRSRHYTIHTVDPPNIRQIRVTYHFPDWTGMKDRVEEQGGDLRALADTQADLEITTDRPMPQGLLVLDNGQKIALSGGANNHYQGSIRLAQDGAYHVAYVDQAQTVRLSEDYFIEARKPGPPTVGIVRPGGDYRASPIEEVTVAVHASDEFGLQHLELHYSVNGAPERTLSLLHQPGAKQATGASVLALEDYKLVPGDVIGLYAVARNARFEAHTDMAFIQLEPFSREFSQSQTAGGGGGGGGGNESSEISQREKEIIAATFKQLNDHTASADQGAQSAKFLSEVQTTLRNQSLALAGRLRSRELTEQNSAFSHFQEEMSAAAAAMSPSSQQLQQQKWQSAIPEEQKALQHLLRAEATFREIEIAFGGGGGGGGGAGRDLASLFDLELDTQKNQYETPQRASSADQRARDIDEALKKLDELARRQEELAQREREDSAAAAEQRWQQELLQREAQQLQQQLEQLAQGSGQSASSAQGGRPAAGQSPDARARSMQQASERALEQLRQAQQDMARAASSGRSAADTRLAAERLREASNALGGLQSQEASRRMESIAHDAQRLASAEADQRERIKRIEQGGAGSSRAPRDVERLLDDRQHMADDLASLEQNMRNAARELDSAQRAAADKLRSALKDVDDSDLESLIQRTADWLRTGISPNSRDAESQIASGLQRLNEQAQQAQQALNAGNAQPGAGDNEEALNRVARLRRQIEALSARTTQQGAAGQSAGAQGRQGSAGQSGNAPGQRGSAGQSGNAPGQQGAAGESGGARGGQQGGTNDSRPGGGGYSGAFVDNNIDTGNNARSGGSSRAPVDAPQPGPDRQALIEQGLGELHALHGQGMNDVQTEREIQQLISEMQHLDLRRFPGNPAMVEHIHQQLLSDVDTLELQLRRRLEEQQSDQIHGVDPLLIPHGYEAAVADYFRRLSAGDAVKSRAD